MEESQSSVSFTGTGTKVLPTFIVYLNFTTMKIISVAEFYEDKNMPLPDTISREIGHFNVFDVAEVLAIHKRTDRQNNY